jgi:8-oxo-dGTP pyrophosphatase MutT (NUDIX family)
MKEILFRKVSVVVFYDKNGRILLQKRSGIQSKSGEDWGFFGGGIEENESPEEAIKREISVELGININEFIKIGEFENIYFNTKMKINRKLYRTIFISPLTSEIQSAKVLEGDGSKLFSISEAKKLKLVPGDIEVIKIFENYYNKNLKKGKKWKKEKKNVAMVKIGTKK